MLTWRAGGPSEVWGSPALAGPLGEAAESRSGAEVGQASGWAPGTKAAPRAWRNSLALKWLRGHSSTRGPRPTHLPSQPLSSHRGAGRDPDGPVGGLCALAQTQTARERSAQDEELRRAQSGPRGASKAPQTLGAEVGVPGSRLCDSPSKPRDGVPRHSVWVWGQLFPGTVLARWHQVLTSGGRSLTATRATSQSNQFCFPAPLHGCAQQMVQTLHSGLTHKFHSEDQLPVRNPWRAKCRAPPNCLPASRILRAPVVVGDSPRGPTGGSRQRSCLLVGPTQCASLQRDRGGLGGLESTKRC